MCGSTRSTTSPSRSSTRRSTPCAAGCCGPKFSVKLRTEASVIAFPRRSRSDAGVELLPRDDRALVAAFADLVDAVMGAHAERDLAPLHLDALGLDRHGEP